MHTLMEFCVMVKWDHHNLQSSFILKWAIKWGTTSLQEVPLTATFTTMHFVANYISICWVTTLIHATTSVCSCSCTDGPLLYTYPYKCRSMSVCVCVCVYKCGCFRVLGTTGTHLLFLMKRRFMVNMSYL